MSTSTSTPIKIALSAGEVSGDQHLSHVIQHLKKIIPNAEFKGMGGVSMRAVGVDTVVDSERTAGVMGFLEVVKKFGDIKASMNGLKTLLDEWKPQLLVVVDFPDFHFRLARYAKELGIPVLYYIPPKVWAWRQGRVKQMKKLFDKLAVIFPFEVPFYKKHKFPNVTFVGHPFSDDVHFKTPPLQSREEICAKYKLDSKHPLILLLPGSRKNEVTWHLPEMLKGIALFREQGTNAQALIAIPDSVRSRMTSLAAYPWCRIVDESALEMMKICDAGILKSGTCNLEAAFLDLPFACFYKAPKIAELIVRSFIKVSQVSPVNIIRENTVTELLQGDAVGEKVAMELQALLTPERRSILKKAFSEVKDSLSGEQNSRLFLEYKSAPERVAHIISQMIQQ